MGEYTRYFIKLVFDYYEYNKKKDPPARPGWFATFLGVFCLPFSVQWCGVSEYLIICCFAYPERPISVLVSYPYRISPKLPNFVVDICLLG